MSCFVGQRYHIVLNADPINTPQNPASPDGNYWIRTVPADGCKGFEVGNEPDERQGILRYNASSKGVPTSFRDNYSLACRDENYTRLEPVYQWNVDEVKLDSKSPESTKETALDKSNPFKMLDTEEFHIGKDGRPERPAPGDNFTWWSFGANPLWLNFSDPTILNLDNTTWDKDYVVVPEHNKDGWVYLAITSPGTPQPGLPGRSFFPVAHPVSPKCSNLALPGFS